MRKIPFTSAVRYRTCGKVQKNEIFFSPYLTEEQTVSKWEAGQSYPDFTRLVMLSDFFDMTLDELVKDIDVQEVRENSFINEKVDSIYRVSQDVDSIIQNKTLKDILRGIKWFIVGSFIFLCLIIIVTLILHFIYPESNIFWHTY